ncbi:hypothetical protein [Frischella perrara]|uniref:hypothetical protein n=1 Tax=Frischella perrara TaxID=1267021 RepID=UPI0023EFF2CD|nr:hypothetical protein [Frischella perrara]
MFTINKFLMTFTALFNQIIDSQFGFIITLTRTQKTKYLYYLNHVISKLIIDDYLISTNIFTFNNNCLPSVINKADYFNQLNLQADLYIIDKKNKSKKKKKSKTLFKMIEKIVFRQANKPFLLIYNLYNHLIYNFSVIYHLDNLENYYKCNDFHSLKSFKSIFTIFSIHSDTLKIINTQKKNLAIEKNHWLNNRYKNDIQGLEDNSLNKLNKKPITIENGTTRLRSVK